jgi:hypothetical protein
MKKAKSHLSKNERYVLDQFKSKMIKKSNITRSLRKYTVISEILDGTVCAIDLLNNPNLNKKQILRLLEISKV